MAKFIKKPVVVEATQWHKNGDHPEDESKMIRGVSTAPFLSEGKVVRCYNDPILGTVGVCAHCGLAMNAHGWIDTPVGGNIVCPGDWIVTSAEGKHYLYKPDIFEAMYEPAAWTRTKQAEQQQLEEQAECSDESS